MHYVTRLTTAEFFCCLSCVKKTWQFSYRDLGWIFKTVASPYEDPTGFVARWKLTATSHWSSSLAPCISSALGSLWHMVRPVLSVHNIPASRSLAAVQYYRKHMRPGCLSGSTAYLCGLELSLWFSYRVSPHWDQSQASVYCRKVLIKWWKWINAT